MRCFCVQIYSALLLQHVLIFMFGKCFYGFTHKLSFTQNLCYGVFKYSVSTDRLNQRTIASGLNLTQGLFLEIRPYCNTATPINFLTVCGCSCAIAGELNRHNKDSVAHKT